MATQLGMFYARGNEGINVKLKLGNMAKKITKQDKAIVAYIKGMMPSLQKALRTYDLKTFTNNKRTLKKISKK